ncbi:DNA-directed RNA polymerase subunit omega [Candidatus Methylacidiphilum infernorum]|uniref:DNA-directed RNA polymerase subunit omega n=1 Tax=Candidatus Methylacidiphilum infernorum TaxID=511746 RepID=A0ABX7PW68_9BACT|nr:DNA-directed RNA polymerase subunit omega [Candidatus Methylacidiphilum infernorum]QSR86816.1 DNA-directed RNA polymerase subunit omega [Candidatus Methylacidiphilum infernorum]
MNTTQENNIAQLLSAALAKVEIPEVLVNMVSRRVRLLAKGAKPLVEVPPQWNYMQIALKEIAEGRLSWEFIPQEEKGESSPEA